MKTLSLDSSPSAPLAAPRAASSIPWIEILPEPPAISRTGSPGLFAYCESARQETDAWEALVFASLEAAALIGAGAAFLSL